MGYNWQRKAKAGYKRTNIRAARNATHENAAAEYDDVEDYDDYDNYDQDDDHHEDDENHDEEEQYIDYEQADTHHDGDNRGEAEEEGGDGHASGKQAAIGPVDLRPASRAEAKQTQLSAERVTLPEHIKKRLTKRDAGLGMSFIPSLQQDTVSENSTAVAAHTRQVSVVAARRTEKAEQLGSPDIDEVSANHAAASHHAKLRGPRGPGFW